MTVRSIPVLRHKDPDVQKVLDAVREALQEGNGERGHPENRWVTVGDLQGTTPHAPTVKQLVYQNTSTAAAAGAIQITCDHATPYVGDSVTLTATVSGGVAMTGTVVFTVDGVDVGTQTLASGAATLTGYQFTQPGVHEVKATYSGDGANAGMTSTPLRLTVSNAPWVGPPLAPTGLAVTSDMWAFHLSWTLADSTTVGATEIWGRRANAAWATGTTYAMNALVADGSGNIYRSLKDGNTAHALTDTTWWATTTLTNMASPQLLASVKSASWTFMSWNGTPLISGETWVFWIRNTGGDALVSNYYPDDLTTGVTSTSANNPLKLFDLMGPQYQLSVDVNGYVSGFALYNTGATSLFRVVADKFVVGGPVAPGVAADQFPFAVIGSTTYLQSAMIQDASIASAKIASLDAAKITTGSLDAARINAGTITASKLVLTGTNLIQDPAYYDPVWWSKYPAFPPFSAWPSTVTPTAGADVDGPARYFTFSAGGQFRFVSDNIPANTGQTYRLKLRIKVNSGTTGNFTPVVLFPWQAWSSFGQPMSGTWTDTSTNVWTNTDLAAVAAASGSLAANTWREYTTLVTKQKMTSGSTSNEFICVGFFGNLTAGSIQAHVEICDAADMTRIANNATRAVFTNGGSLAVTTASVNGPVSVTCSPPPLGRNASGTNRVTVIVTGTLYSTDASASARAHDLNIIRTDDTFTATGCTIATVLGTGVLTIGTVTAGTVRVGQIITGTGVAADTRIVSGSGSTWNLSVAQTVASTTISAIGRVLLSGPPTLFSIGGGNRGTGGGSGPTFALQAVDGDLSVPNGGPVSDTASPVYTLRVTPGGAYASYTFSYGITAIDAYK